MENNLRKNIHTCIYILYTYKSLCCISETIQYCKSTILLFKIIIFQIVLFSSERDVGGNSDIEVATFPNIQEVLP